MTRPMFPHTVDSTILGSFRSCPQKFFRQYIQHWKPVAQSVHLVAGGAFASGIEAARLAYFVKGMSVQEAEAEGMTALIRHYGDFQCPADSPKSLERMIGALEYYLSMYPLGADTATPIILPGGKTGIEFSFAEPLSVCHPVTGDPILYTGRSDMVAQRFGGIYVYDEKTTGQLGASWSKQWEMRSQFTGYMWALRRNGVNAAGAIVRGIAIRKTGYDTLEVPTYRTPYELDLWEKQVESDVRRMIQCWESGWWDYNFDGSCTDFGGCSFVEVCKSPEPEKWLPVKFAQRVWDPLARKELTVEEYEASWGHVPEGIPALPKHDPALATALGAQVSQMLRK